MILSRSAGWSLIVGVITVFAVSLTGCVAVPTGTAGVSAPARVPMDSPVPLAPSPSSSEGPRTPAGTELSWRACPDVELAALECATVTFGSATSVAVARLPARGPAPRLGVLLLGMGGPAFSGLDLLGGNASHLPARLRESFDIVAFDPVGVGRTAGVTCPERELRTWAGAELTQDDRLDDDLFEAADRLLRSCLPAHRSVLELASTDRQVEVVEALRMALGEPRISYLGISHDALTASAYAARHPSRVRALVLDSPVAPGLSAERFVLDRAAATEQSLARFVRHCAATACLPGRVTPAQVMTHVDGLLAQARRRPLAADPPGRALTLRDLHDALLAGLQDERAGFRDLAAGLSRLEGGETTLLRQLADAYQLRSGSGGFSSWPVVSAAYTCRDHAWPSTRRGWHGLTEEARRVAPRLGAAIVRQVAPCLAWNRVMGQAPPAPLGMPPVPAVVPATLVTASRGDPVTPLSWAERTAARSGRGTVLLTAGGAWHGAILSARSACLTTAAAEFLVTADRNVVSEVTC